MQRRTFIGGIIAGLAALVGFRPRPKPLTAAQVDDLAAATLKHHQGKWLLLVSKDGAHKIARFGDAKA